MNAEQTIQTLIDEVPLDGPMDRTATKKRSSKTKTVKAPAKPKKYVELYYSLEEDEMQLLIREVQCAIFIRFTDIMFNKFFTTKVRTSAYKPKAARAQQYLLDIFSNFLSKYITMIYYGRFDVNNYDNRKFLSLFIKDNKTRYALQNNRLSREGFKVVMEALRGIQYMVNRYNDELDVEQTIKMAFLECIHRYERKGEIPFSGYLYSYFCYVLKKQIEIHLIDQLGRKRYPLITDADFESSDSDGEQPVGFQAPPDHPADEMLFGELINDEWVAGITPQFPFNVLTVQERQLLKWRYVNEEKPSQIAARTTEHPNTIREHFFKIKMKIRAAVGSDLNYFVS